MNTSGLRSVTLLASLCLVTAGTVGAEARDIKVVRKAVLPVETAAPIVPIIRDVTPVGLKATIAPANIEITPSCGRKVKVIYAGYGEAGRATPCQSAEGQTASSTTVATR